MHITIRFPKGQPEPWSGRMVKIQSVTFEHHRENLAIGEREPRLSWSFNGDARDWIQSSYEIEVSRPLINSNQPKVFQVKSSDSVLVPWPSTPLHSRETARVRVRATGGKTNEPTPWSEVATVETGLLAREDWTASLVGAKRTFAPSGALRPALFRKAFQISSVVRIARLYITSYGVYEAQINGRRVGDHVMAPGWTSYKHHLNYNAFDITELLQSGKNCIGVEVGEGWFSTRLGWHGGKRNIYGDRLALLVQLEIVFQNGQSMTINSDKSWKSSVGPRIASEIYDGETYDASLEVDWSLPVFDGNEWSAVEKMDFPTARLQSPNGPPVRKTQTLKAHKIFKSPKGKVVVDFGQNLVGWVKVSVSGPKGHKITFTHTEVLEHGEVATRPLRDCKATDTLILAGHAIEWEPKFTFHGFRYVQVDGWPSGEPKLVDIDAVVVHTDMEQTGWFSCSDPMVNKLHQNIQWGMRGNFLSIPTDCPQRDERLGWTGDIQIFSPTASFLYNTSGMLCSWLRDLSAEQLLDYKGVPPLVCPNIIDSTPQAAWSDVAVITPYDLYTAFGDVKILADQYESMKTWVDHGIPRQANGLWDPSTSQLGDWLDPDAPPSEPAKAKTDPHLVANAYLCRVTALMAEISKILDFSEDAQNYEKEAKNIKRQFQNEYVTPSGRLAPDTMTSLAQALAWDLFPSASQASAAAVRLAKVVRASRFRISTGFVGTPLICPVLTKTGNSQLAYGMLLEKKCPSWLYPITMGATTMWERWDSMLPDGTINPGEMTSFNHYALGSVGAWLHATVGGISPAEPGWRKIRFEPIPGGTIKSAEVKYKSAYGMVECTWTVEKGEFCMKAKVPPNCRAEVKLPGMNKVEGVGSGSHEFRCKYEELEWPPEAIYNPFAQYKDQDD